MLHATQHGHIRCLGANKDLQQVSSAPQSVQSLRLFGPRVYWLQLVSPTSNALTKCMTKLAATLACKK